MEEKERYSWYNHSTEEIYDNKDDIVFVGAITVLNQQNRRIWELIEENKQLKQSQKQLAISELEKIYNLFEPYENSQKDTILCANNGISFVDYLENQIKSLKGEE